MKLLENQFDEFEKCFNDNDAVLRNDGVFLDSLGLCMSIIRQFSLVFPQICRVQSVIMNLFHKSNKTAIVKTIFAGKIKYFIVR